MIYVFTKYVWVQPLKDKKPKAVLNAFNETAKKSKRQPNKLWVDQGREFYNNPCKNGRAIMMFSCTQLMTLFVLYSYLIFMIHSLLKKFKWRKWRKIIGSFYEKEWLLSKL